MVDHKFLGLKWLISAPYWRSSHFPTYRSTHNSRAKINAAESPSFDNEPPKPEIRFLDDRVNDAVLWQTDTLSEFTVN